MLVFLSLLSVLLTTHKLRTDHESSYYARSKEHFLGKVANRRYQAHHPEVRVTGISEKLLSPNQNNDGVRPETISVAYAISITSCPTKIANATSTGINGERENSDMSIRRAGPTVWDGPAILAQSIRSIHSKKVQQNSKEDQNEQRSVNGTKPYNYSYDLYAFVLPSAAEGGCGSALESLGYDVVVRDIPFEVKDIKDDNYREKIETNGCCGAKEFLKLLAYSLDGSGQINEHVHSSNRLSKKHDIVVHVDTDTFFIQPLDILFDAMMDSSPSLITARGQYPLPPEITMDANEKYRKKRIDFFYTRDYLQDNLNAVDLLRSLKPNNGFRYTPSWLPIQGGFFIARPNRHVLSNMVETILEGKWHQSKKHGGFWGEYQIQGFLSYWYSKENDRKRDGVQRIANTAPGRDNSHDHHRSGNAVELNPCRFNTMTHEKDDSKNREMKGYAMSLPKCASTPMDQIYSVHFTKCWKPWDCPRLTKVHPPICAEHHRKWFELRRSLELEWNRTVPVDGWHFERTLGYCRKDPPRKKRYYSLLEPLI